MEPRLELLVEVLPLGITGHHLTDLSHKVKRGSDTLVYKANLQMADPPSYLSRQLEQEYPPSSRNDTVTPHNVRLGIMILMSSST